MTPEQFVMWLAGFVEGAEGSIPNDVLGKIVEKIAKVNMGETAPSGKSGKRDAESNDVMTDLLRKFKDMPKTTAPNDMWTSSVGAVSPFPHKADPTDFSAVGILTNGEIKLQAQ